MRQSKIFGRSLLEVDKSAQREESTSIGLLNPKILKGNLLVRYVVFVINSMLSHSFRVYLWLKELIKTMESRIRNFIRTANVNNDTLVIVSWKQSCRSIKDGSLGLKILKCYKVCLMKLTMYFLDSDFQWARILRLRAMNGNLINTSYFEQQFGMLSSIMLV